LENDFEPNHRKSIRLITRE